MSTNDIRWIPYTSNTSSTQAPKHYSALEERAIICCGDPSHAPFLVRVDSRLVQCMACDGRAEVGVGADEKDWLSSNPNSTPSTPNPIAQAVWVAPDGMYAVWER